MKNGYPVLESIRKRFSLHDDKASDKEIDQRLRSGVEMQGTNLWVLMFAIFIASIGLNVNSTAVIIGAMLISPLMGPIMGIGYGVGILDFPLIKKSLANLGIATIISLTTSTVYFLITPLTTVQSELLARTTPSIWDVLIALFGGLAGIVATTRQEKSNTIPGVAIATALMPPLCTAGFGLANQNWDFVFGAFYLFTINGVFIALSSAMIIRAYHVQEREFIDENTTKRVHIYMGLVVILTALPSLYLAYKLVGDEVFHSKAEQFIAKELESSTSHVVSTNINAKEREIKATLVGDIIPQETLKKIEARMVDFGLSDVKLKIYQNGEPKPIDVAILRKKILGDSYKVIPANIEQEKIDMLTQEVNLLRNQKEKLLPIPEELHALYPQITDIYLVDAPSWSKKNGWNSSNTLLLNLRLSKALHKDELARIEQWIMKRLQIESVYIVQDVKNTTR